MLLLKGIYRQTIDNIRRAHMDFLSYGAKMMELNQQFDKVLGDKHKEMKVIAYDEQIQAETKYILLNTMLDELEKATQNHLARVNELKVKEKKLHNDIQTFIERCAADHPELDKDDIMSTVLETIKK